MSASIDSIGVVGGGAWGTALAEAARLAGRQTLLWARDAAVVDEINTRHTNAAYLPGLALDAELTATSGELCWAEFEIPQDREEVPAFRLHVEPGGYRCEPGTFRVRTWLEARGGPGVN